MKEGVRTMNGSELLPSNGEIRATVFYTVGLVLRSRDGWWRVETRRNVSGVGRDVVVGRNFRGRNTFPLCGLSEVVDVVPVSVRESETV